MIIASYLRALALSVSVLGLYPPAHPRTRRATLDTVRAFNRPFGA